MMSKDCNIRVEIDGDTPPVLRDTETLTGTVYVEVGEEVQCDGLSLVQRWETHGKGDSDTGEGHQTTLFQGTWQPGQSYEYPFEMEVPPGPYTYRGHYINIDWELEATADIPWALDPSGKEDFVLEPGGRDGYVPGRADSEKFVAEQPDDHESQTWVRVLFGLVFLGAGLATGYLSVFNAGSFFGLLFGLVFSGAGLLLLYMAIRNYFAEMQLGDVDVEMLPEVAYPGDELECRFSLDPQQSVDLERAIVRLEGEERATYTHGTDTHTVTKTVHNDQAVPEASVDADLQPNGRTDFVTTLQVPDSVPYTFEASDNEIRWQIVYQVEIPSWPDWSHTRQILVRPPADDRIAADEGDEQPAEPTPSTAGEETEDAYAETW